MSMVNSQTQHWTKTAFGGLQTTVTNFIADAKLAKLRRAKFRETYSELAGLTDRDLLDIGIARSDIEWLATQESMKITAASI